MLIDKRSSTVLLGAGFTATVEMILEFIERERHALMEVFSRAPALRP
jgi:hypothetical protein